MATGSLFRGASRLAGMAAVALALAQPAAAGVNVWTPVGPWGGVVFAVAIHPTDPRHVYAATSNGVFVSVDGGASWQSSSPNWEGSDRSTLDVVAAPSSPSTVYASNGRLFRSTDGGATWQRRSPAGFVTAPGLAVDPRNPEVLWTGSMGSQRGILKSVDGGATFQVAFTVRPPIESIAFAPWDHDTIFAGISSSFAEPPWILRSTDGGATWQRLESGLDLSVGELFQVRIAPAPDSPGTVYAAFASHNDPVHPPVIFRSRDGGDTWERSGPGGYPVAAGLHGAVYSGSGARSLDFGDTWSTPARPNGQVYDVAADPLTPGTAWAGTLFRGLFKTTDGGDSWRPAHQGIAATQVTSLAIDPVHPSVLYAGLNGGGLFKTGRGGTIWRQLDPGLPDPDLFSTFTGLAVDPRDPDRVYMLAETGAKVLGSQDGGLSWQDLNHPRPSFAWTYDLTPDPGASRVLYAPGVASGGCQSYKMLDGGARWTCLNLLRARRIVVDPREPSNVYAVTDVVARSVDRGRTWTTARRGIPSATFASSLAVSPSSPNVLYLGVTQGVYKSTDHGETWRSASVGLPPNKNVIAVAVDPRAPSIAWVMVDSRGVYRTTDGGAHWRPLNGGLPLHVSGQLVLDPRDPNTAYAGSVGGVYKITVR